MYVNYILPYPEFEMSQIDGSFGINQLTNIQHT